MNGAKLHNPLSAALPVQCGAQSSRCGGDPKYRYIIPVVASSSQGCKRTSHVLVAPACSNTSAGLFIAYSVLFGWRDVNLSCLITEITTHANFCMPGAAAMTCAGEESRRPQIALRTTVNYVQLQRFFSSCGKAIWPWLFMGWNWCLLQLFHLGLN